MSDKKNVVIRLNSGREIATEATWQTWTNIRQEIESYPSIELVKDGKVVVVLTRQIESIEIDR
ncbi:hypothetical protein [Glycomyces tenuis]|uniref:hypothetical protein n=1 Tax=Glycomyces tenuis TaxID=58116 RepID=UPI0004287416|nr:hypothetical protein [Glycomyces tenuis]